MSDHHDILSSPLVSLSQLPEASNEEVILSGRGDEVILSGRDDEVILSGRGDELILSAGGRHDEVILSSSMGRPDDEVILSGPQEEVVTDSDFLSGVYDSVPFAGQHQVIGESGTRRKLRRCQ